MSDKIERTIRESPLFKHLSEQRLEELTDASSIVEFDEGELIIEEETSVDRLYIVLEGRIRVWTTGPKGEVELKTLGPGAYFGEVSLMSGNDATANVEARQGATRCVGIRRDYLTDLVESDQKIRKMLQGVTMARAKDTIGKVFK